MTEEILCASAYAAWAADSILIHSRKSAADEFPLVGERFAALPATHSLPNQLLSKARSVHIVIPISPSDLAQPFMQTAIAATQRVCGGVIAEDDTTGIEPQFATLHEVFRFVRYYELDPAEARWLTDLRK